MSTGSNRSGWSNDDLSDREGYQSGQSGRESAASQGTQDPRQHDYLWLGADHCRAAMRVRVGRSTQVPVVCPRLSESCGYHDRQRRAGEVEDVGAYLRFIINIPPLV